MKNSYLSQVLAALAAAVGAVVVVLEVSYWVSHTHRAGPAPHIALCGAGILLLAAAQLFKQR